MESQKKKKGVNEGRSPISLTDRGRRGVKFVTVGDEVGDEEKQKKAKVLRKEGRKNSVSPLPRSSDQKDNKHAADKAHGPPTPASTEASRAIDVTKPSKKTQFQSDPTRIAKLAPVAKTIGLLRSPAKVTTAKSDSSRQGSRRTSLTSTHKPKIKMKRSKTEDDNAEEGHLEEKGKKERRILDIRLPEIIIDVPKDNIEEFEKASPAKLVQNLQTANIISDRQVCLDDVLKVASFFFCRCQRDGNRWSQAKKVPPKI